MIEGAASGQVPLVTHRQRLILNKLSRNRNRFFREPRGELVQSEPLYVVGMGAPGLCCRRGGSLIWGGVSVCRPMAQRESDALGSLASSSLRQRPRPEPIVEHVEPPKYRVPPAHEFK